MCVCGWVVFNANPLHFTCFELHFLRIDGVSVVSIPVTHLGQITLLGSMCICICVLKATEVTVVVGFYDTFKHLRSSVSLPT